MNGPAWCFGGRYAGAGPIAGLGSYERLPKKIDPGAQLRAHHRDGKSAKRHHFAICLMQYNTTDNNRPTMITAAKARRPKVIYVAPRATGARSIVTCARSHALRRGSQGARWCDPDQPARSGPAFGEERRTATAYDRWMRLDCSIANSAESIGSEIPANARNMI